MTATGAIAKSREFDSPNASAISPVMELARRFAAVSFASPCGGMVPERRQQRLFRWLVFGMFAVYIAGAVAFFVWRGQVFRPDNWALFLLVGAILLGRIGPFLRDWIPFVLLVFGYEFLRGVAGEFVTGGRTVGDRAREELPNVRVESLVDFDVALMFGHEPVSTLQGWLYTPGDPKWWDYLALIVYSMHFALPCIFAFLLWITRKERFWQFTIAFCLMTYSAFAFFLLYPAAPPWLANSWGVVSGIGWPAGSVTASIGVAPIQALDTVSIWQNASPHPVAAMPSLHAGFPWMVLLFAVKYFRWKGLLVVPYNLALWFSVVYLANHWVVDILAGMAWATLAFVITDWAWNRLAGEPGTSDRSPTRFRVKITAVKGAR
ncbi:MAG: inositol phosphorylceramide synthase [Chloroflexia bacterium]|nr:inositol phosphorylceramide synthase [Chloroflexia bacterium]